MQLGQKGDGLHEGVLRPRNPIDHSDPLGAEACAVDHMVSVVEPNRVHSVVLGPGNAIYDRNHLLPAPA